MRRNTPRKTLAQQQAILARWAKSGLSAAAFCRNEAINYPAFCKWRSASKAIPSPAPKADPQFISLAPLIHPSDVAGWNIVLQLAPGIEIRLSQIT